MQPAYVVTGALTDARTIALDEPISNISGRVRLIVEGLPSETKPDLRSFMERMWEEQRKRGHVPRTHEQAMADLKAERDSWDD